MTRTDLHRPSVLIPSEYTHVISFAMAVPELFQPAIGIEEALEIYGREGARVHGGIHQCDICGARYTYGSLFRHTPTGQVISIGHDCADRLELASEYESVYHEAKRLGLQGIERRERYIGLRLFARNDRVLLGDLKVKHPIIQDIRNKLISNGARYSLTPKQIALVVKLAYESRQPAEKHVPVPIIDGRQRVEGIVVGTKIQESNYGDQLKMTIKVNTPEGSWLVYGSVPSKLLDEVYLVDEAAYKAWTDEFTMLDGETRDDFVLRCKNGRPIPERQGIKGHTISFEAKLQLGRDAHFAFFSRPTKSKLIA